MINERLYGLGTSVYSAIYAPLSTEVIAAVGVVMPVGSLIYPYIIGLSNACSVIVGNALGEGDEEKADRYTKHTLFLMFCLGIAVGWLVFINCFRILSIFDLSETSSKYGCI